jgi:hypothetical protein
MATSPSTAAGTFTERFVGIRRMQPAFAASGTSAAVFIIDLREKSAI